MTQNEIRIEIDAQTADLTKKLRRLEEQLKGLDNTKLTGLTNQNKQLTRSFQQLTTHVAKLATIYGGFHALVGAGVDTANFEQAIKRLGVYTGATAAELDMLKAKALELGRETMYSASQVAGALNEMGLAGLSVQDQLTGVDDVLNLAAVGMISIEDATKIAATTMKSFGLSADELKSVTDVISRGATLSATSITELGEALGRVSPVSHSLGIDLETTTAALDVLADASIRGSRGGNQLKMVLSRLAANPEAKKYLDQLGISMYGLNGKLLPLKDQLLTLKKALSGLSEQARNTYIGRIAGEEAKASLIALMNNTDKLTESMKELHKAINEDFAATSAKDMMDTLRGSFLEFKSAVESLTLKIGEVLIPVIRDMLDEWTRAINEMTPDEIASLQDSFIEFAKAIEGAVHILNFFAGMVSDVVTGIPHLATAFGVVYVAAKKLELEAIAPLITKLEVMAGVSAGMFAPIVASVALLGGAIYDMVQQTENANDSLVRSISQTADKVGGLTDSVMRYYNEESKSLEMTAKQRDLATKAIDREIKSVEAKLAVDSKWFQNSELYKKQQESLNQNLHQLKLLRDRVASATLKEADATDKATKANKSNNAGLIAVQANIKKLTNKYRDLETAATNALSKQKEHLSKLNAELQRLRDDALKIDRKYYNDAALLEIDYQKRIADIRGSEVDKARLILDEEAKAQKEFYAGNYELAAKYYDEIQSFADNLKVGSISANGEILQNEEQVKAEKLRLTQEVFNARMAILNQEKIAELEANKAKIDMKIIEINLVKEQIKLQSSYITSLKNGINEVNANKLRFTDPKTEKTLKTLNGMTADLKKKLSEINVKIKDAEAKAKLADLTKTKYNIKVGADTSPAKKDIATIPETIKPVQVSVGANTEPLTTEMRLVRGHYQQIPVNLPIGAETAYLEAKVRAMVGDISTTEADMIIGADTEPSRRDVQGLVAEVGTYEPKTQPVVLDLNDAVVALNLFRQYMLDTPLTIGVDVHTDAAASQVSAFVSWVNSQSATIDIYEVIHPARAGGGMIPKFATGGYFAGSGSVPGYDPTDSDRVHALLTGGEFVVRRQAVDNYGQGILHAINNMSFPKPEGYAKGGVVKGYAAGGAVHASPTSGIHLPTITQDIQIVSNADEVNRSFEVLVGTIKSLDSSFVSADKTQSKVVRTSEVISTSYDRAADSANSYADAIGRLADYENSPASSMVTKWSHEDPSYWNTGGHIPKFAGGGKFTGYVPGYDPTDSDGVLARLTGGEYVIRRQAVDKYGVGIMERINNMQFNIGYATGGLVKSYASGGSVSNGGAMDTVRVELQIGDRNFEMLSDRAVAKALGNYMKTWGRQ